MTVLIRRADASDVRAVRLIGLETWPATYGFAGADYIDHGLSQWWTPEAVAASIDDTVTFVASDEGETVGMANLDLRQDPPTMWKLYVVPGFHGKGIGSLLLQAVIDAVPDDMSTLRLDVTRGNDRAQEFYRRKGFVETGLQPDDNPDWPPTVWMELNLR